MLACLAGDYAVCVDLSYPHITKVGTYQYFFMNIAAYSPFKQIKIMLFPAPFSDIQYPSAFPFYNHLGFYGMALLFPRIVFFLFFLGLFIGLSVTSTTMYSLTAGISFKTFLPGSLNALSFFSVFSTH